MFRRLWLCFLLSLSMIAGGAACWDWEVSGSIGRNFPDECPGQCVRLPPLGFDGPALLWVGPAAEVPDCPDRAPARVFEGFDGLLDMPLNCPACACSQPTCAFPTGLTAYTQPACQGSAADFPAPVPWSGACTSPAVLPSGQAQSMLVAEPTEHPCAPIVDVPQKEHPGPGYTVAARACAGETYPERCPDRGDTCLPTADPPPPGFRQCVMYLRDGDTECPESYPDKVKVYGGVEDTRKCTACTCTKTASASCVAEVSTYQDTACSVSPPLVVAPVTLGQGGPSCSDSSAPVLPLGSMEATWMINEPGACQASGGEAIGAATAIDPRVFCCQGAFDSAP